MALEVDGRAARWGATHYTGDVLEVVQGVLAGEASQWPLLVREVHALAIAVCKRQLAADGSDFANNVALRVIERLRKDEYKALHRFIALRESYPKLGFEKWTRGIINNAAMDEVRSQPEFGRVRTAEGRELRRREHVAFEDEAHAESPASANALDARRILRCIQSESFPEEQRQALLLWVSGHSVDDCAEALGRDVESARRCLQAGRQRLRRHFKERS